MKAFLTLNRLPSKLPPGGDDEGLPHPPLPYLAKGLSCSPLSARRVQWGKEGLRFFPSPGSGSVPGCPGPCLQQGSQWPVRSPSVPRPNPLVSFPRSLAPLPEALLSLQPSAPWLRGSRLLMDSSLPEAGKSLCWENHFFTLQICLFQHFCKAGASPLGETGTGRHPRTQDSVSCLDRG